MKMKTTQNLLTMQTNKQQNQTQNMNQQQYRRIMMTIQTTKRITYGMPNKTNQNYIWKPS